MMDTILNVGLNDESVGGLARSIGKGFARDAIAGCPDVRRDGRRSAELRNRRHRRRAEVYEGPARFPRTREQLRLAITAVFDS
jgi:hypothetical protein